MKRSGLRSWAGIGTALCIVSSLEAAEVSVAWNQPTAGVAVALDAANNVFTATHTYALGGEIALTKRDADGHLLWQASFDQTDLTKWEAATWVATDGQGNALVSGSLMSGYSNPVNAASLLMKFDPGGNVLWRQVYESSFDGSYTRKCVVDENDNVYVLGTGSGPAGYVTKVKKFAPDGTALWSYFDDSGIGLPVNLKLTPDGNLVIAARSKYGSINGYAKLDRDGRELWSLPGTNSLTVGDAAGDVHGNTYVVHGEYVSGGGTVVRKLDGDGSLLWQHTYPSAGFRIEVGNDDRAVVSGFPSQSTGGAAFFKLDQDGALLWANLDADGPHILLLHAQMLLDHSNDAYLAAGTLFDMAVCKVRSDGSSAWTATTPSSYATGIALANLANGVFVVGGATARLTDSEEGVWTNLGQGLAGSGGAPKLHGSGVLQAGKTLFAHVESALPSTLGVHVFGASEVWLPLLGGTLVPSPNVLLPLATDAYGRASLSGAVGSAGPGSTLWMQAWFLDPSAPQSFSATNALKTAAP